MKILLDTDIEGIDTYNSAFFESIARVAGEHVEIDEDAEISVLLTDDSTIQELNNNYRDIDSPTDVLSFPMGENSMLGDIVISVETAHRQATDGHAEEMAFLFIHGVLHLLGYEHEESYGVPEAEAEEMYALQEKILYAWCDRGEKSIK